MTEQVAAQSKKRRGPSALVVTGILGLLVALLGAGAALVVRYQPLQQGSSAVAPAGSKEVASTDPTDDRPVEIVQYKDGATVSYGFSIRNAGRWGITVTGFGRKGERPVGLLDHFEYQLSDTGFSNKGAFAPFALGPGKERSIFVTATFFNCESYVALGGIIYSFVTVRFRTVGIEKTVDFPFTQRIEVVSPANANCPRPRAA